MASRPPPPPSSFPGIAVDDMLALPGIQEVLTTDAPEVQDEVTSEEGAGSSSVVFRPSEELDSEKQPLGERKTTRSIPACIATSAITERSGLEAPTQDQVQLQSPQNKKRQHIRVPSVAELDELRHKLQANATTVGHDKHQKQKTRIRALRAELARLRQFEAQLQQYEQRPLSSLQGELQTRQREIADLSNKLQRATQEELDW
ncbi:hypothetical protein PF005_g26824 [Phytophthora fragariae]|uniref:Uncharacterized protein n=1 Tax=Phytophthora fragariae TaxID=53985 RepID=A0A6A3W2F6_9STRA|nr:hypothetical protein PF009_g26846 [Phytophthora fragariae]KAE9089382.1 hypothetical protein PF006_g25375 [Phytophthora fragariae]KAE9172190.1 hypothetical protein PF005_g26824 [Phytophthora fragariae]